MYKIDKNNKVYTCLCHDASFNNRDEVYSHCILYKKENGNESKYEKHRRGGCGKQSRMCRYCHPEKIMSAGNIPPEEHIGKGVYIHGTIEVLLRREGRYRNKFKEEHLKQLDVAYRGNRLEKMIRSRLEKRIKIKPHNDGHQTPYIKHGIDVASHTCAVCCRTCIYNWHGLNKIKELENDEIDFLVKVMLTYIIEYIIPDGPVRNFMKELNINEKGWYYNPGVYDITLHKVIRIGDCPYKLK